MGPASHLTRNFLSPMSLKKIITVMFVLTQVLSGSSWGKADLVPQEDSTPAIRRALLIGISQYYALPTLEGAVNDVALLKHVLTTRYGFLPEHVEVLRNGAATRGAILHELRELIKNARANDVVYIHFSGHGSQVKDFDGDEGTDGKDETLVPADGRTPGIPDITDDELERIFHAIQSQATIITVDACHSGSITRGDIVKSRVVPQDTRLDLYQSLPSPTRGGMVQAGPSTYVLMTGAAAHEKALDASVNGIHYGLFSYALVRSLSRLPLQASTQEVFRESQKELLTLRPQIGRRTIPSPQLESPPERLDSPLFPPIREKGSLGEVKNEAARLPWLAVTPIDKNHVVLDQGLELGVQPGSVWGIYPPGEKAFPPDQAQAFALVIKPKDQKTIGKVSPKDTVVVKGSRAVLFASAPKSQDIRVRFRDVPAVHQETLKERLQHESQRINIVAAGERAEVLINVKEDIIQILSADSEDVLGNYSQPDLWQSMKQLVTALTRDQTVANLSWIDNPVSQIRLKARVVQAKQNQQANQNRLSDPVLHIRGLEEPRASTNSLQLELWSNMDGYLTILDIDQSGEASVLFPNRHQRKTFYPDGLIRAGEKITIPDTLEARNVAGFHWDIAGRPGRESIWIVQSTSRIAATHLRNYIAESFRQTATERTRGGHKPPSFNPMAGLREELIQHVTGGQLSLPASSTTSIGNNGPQFRSGRESIQADWTSVFLSIAIEKE